MVITHSKEKIAVLIDFLEKIGMEAANKAEAETNQWFEGYYTGRGSACLWCAQALRGELNVPTEVVDESVIHGCASDKNA